MKKRALLIGINEYDFLGPLSCARKDAQDFAKALKERCGFTDNELTLMTCASRGGLRGDSRYIEHKLTDLTEYKDLDLLIFGFWGHGFAPEGGRRYLCGLNAQDDDLERSAVSLDVVKAKLAQVGALNTLLVLDCCQNRPAGRGAAVDLEEGAEEQFASMARDIQTSRKQVSGKGVPTTAIMNSCREGQRAFEWEDKGHGIFTAHLLDGLEQGKTSVAQLATHVCDHTPETALALYRKEQVPWFFIEGRGDITLPDYNGPPPRTKAKATSQWWVSVKGDERGPLNKAAVLTLIERGEVTTSDQCWCKDMDDWEDLGEAPEWAGRFETVQTIPPTREPPADPATDASDPDDAVACYNRGVACYEEGDYDKAIADFTEAIRLDAKYAAAYHVRGNVFRDKGEYDKAIADWTEAIRLDPEDSTACYNRGFVYNQKGKYDEAIADNTEAIRLDPEYTAAYNNRGFAYNEKGEYDKAIADYTEAIRLDAKYATAYNNRGFAYRKKGEYDKAIADYTEAIRLDPDDAVAYHDRGFAYRKKGDYDTAITDYTEAIRLDPKDVDAYGNRGFAYFQKGDYDEAIADYTEAIRLDPEDADAYGNRGYVYKEKGEYDEAKADFKQAKKLQKK